MTVPEIDVDITGEAETPDGLIRAVVDVDGRVRELTIASRRLAPGRRGETVDPAQLAAAIAGTINAAIDDLATRGVGRLAATRQDLQRTAAEFEQSMRQLGADIEQDSRRLD